MNMASRSRSRTQIRCGLLFMLLMSGAPLTAVELQPGTMVLATFQTAQQTLKIATSADGTNFQMLLHNGSESLYSAPAGAVRDPSICHVGDSYYVAYTAGNFGDAQHFSIIRSQDLQTWTPVTNVDTSSLAPTHTWAPELFADDDGTVTAFVALETTNNQFKLYYSTATDASLSNWTVPAPVGGAFSGRVCIDPHVIKKGGIYYLSYRHYDNGGTGDYIEIATSPSLTTGYTLLKTGDFAGWGGGGKEGPCLTWREDGKWRMYLSDSTQPLSPIVFSDSLDNMTTWSPLTLIASNTNIPPLAHGTAITIPRKVPDFTLQLIAATQDAHLSFTAAPGLNYILQYRNSLGSGPWLTLQNFGSPATTQTLGATDPGALQNAMRFYRVIGTH